MSISKNKKIVQVFGVLLIALFCLLFYQTNSVKADTFNCLANETCELTAFSGSCGLPAGNEVECTCPGDGYCGTSPGEFCGYGPDDPSTYDYCIPPDDCICDPFYSEGYYEGYYEGSYGPGYSEGYYEGSYGPGESGYYSEGYYEGYYEGSYGPGEASYYAEGVYYAEGSYYSEGAYVPPGPNAPSGIQLETGPCSDLRFSWLDNSANENGFRISYRLAPGGPSNFIADVGASAGSGSRVTYTWANPPVATPVWIVVTAYLVSGGVNIYSTDVVSGSSYITQSCFPDFSDSRTTVYAVNNNTSATTATDGDVITFRIIIQNNGTAPASLTSLGDVLHPNPANDGRPVQLVEVDKDSYGCANPTGHWRTCVDRDGDGLYNEVGEGQDIGGVTPNLTTNLVGTKCTTANHSGCTSAQDPSCTIATSGCGNWVILLSARIATAVPGAKLEIWNQSNINYSYSGVPGTVTIFSPRFIVNNTSTKAPKFREISP